jgi:hypothetical protein
VAQTYLALARLAAADLPSGDRGAIETALDDDFLENR